MKTNSYLKPWVEAHLSEFPAARYALKHLRYQAIADAAHKAGLPSTVSAGSVGGAVIAIERKARRKARGQKAARTRMANQGKSVVAADDVTVALEQALVALTKVESAYKALREKLSSIREVL